MTLFPDKPRKGRLIVISGPSGAGKGTVISKLTGDFHLSVSATTREARPAERPGEDYFFVSDEEFHRRIDEGGFLEWANYNQDLYGTPRQAVLDAVESGSDVIAEIEVQGAAQVRAVYPDAVLVFISPPSVDVLEKRLVGRGDTTDEDIVRRLDIAAREMELAPALFDHVVVNDDLERASAELSSILWPEAP
ncbi:MAG: guanylate kinase [Acidimicrobiia bacterium]